jgi:hypothetical protein
VNQNRSLNLSRPERPVHFDHPVVGYRVFRLYDGGRHWDINGRLVPVGPLRLTPLNSGFGDWQPGVNVAQHAPYAGYGDRVDGHICPDPKLQCGFWLLFDRQAAGVKDSWVIGEGWFPVIGAVQGWGRVQEHDDGWRVQYASVLALSLKPPTGVVVPMNLVPYAEQMLKQLCQAWDILYVEDYMDLAKEAGDEKPR